MSSETMAMIHKLANERHLLYRLAGKGQATPEQMARITELSNRLPLLWDQYRRELAAERTRTPRRERAEARAA